MPLAPRSLLALACAACFAVPAVARADDDLPKASDVLKGYEKVDGFYALYRKGHQVYLEVPAGRLDKPFLLATSVAGGPGYTGYQWWDTVCAWQRLDNRLLLVEREVRYRVRDRRKPMAGVVARTYSDRLIKALPIKCLNGSNPVIDLNALFGGSAQEFFGRMAARLDRSVVMVDTLKAFPENVEVALTLPDGARDGRFTTLAYSLSNLPDPQSDRYRPRTADDRVGYFLTAVKDFTDDTANDDRFVRFVNRWNLEKADPSLERSPVKDPIIFYVEDTVPFRFRQAVAEGILEWNKAFEAVGLQGAIVVRQQTDTEFADLDPEDVRYNFFRWIVSERAFAMGPSRVVPWSGQILDADIIFDESMVRVYLREYDVAIKEDARHLFAPRLQRLLEQNPGRYPFAHADVPTGADDTYSAYPLPDASVCSFGPGVVHQLNLGGLAAGLAEQGGGGVPGGFVNALVKDVVMHEVGHTLGLRHNFKASAWRSMAEINSEEKPVPCASVMDYNPINVAATPETPQGQFTMPTIGPYDMWAIQYGYGDFKNDDELLKATAAAVASPQYAYATDEDTTGPDPYTVRWDLGADPLTYAQERLTLARRLLAKMPNRVVKDGEDYAKARRAVDMLLYDIQGAALTAARFVGGQQVHRDHKGDPGARDPVVPVPGALQRQALEFVCDEILREGSIRLDPALLRLLGRGNWRHWGSSDTSRPHSYPYHDRVLTVQSWALFGLMNPGTLGRLVDTEAKSDAEADRLTVPEIFSALSDAIFSWVLTGGPPERLADDRNPLIATTQRNLQRHYVGELIDMVLETESGPTPPVVRNLARLELETLKGSLDDLPMGALDTYTRAHLEAIRERITKALTADFQIGGGASGGGGIILLRGEGGQLVPGKVIDGVAVPLETREPQGPDALPWNRR